MKKKNALVSFLLAFLMLLCLFVSSCGLGNTTSDGSSLSSVPSAFSEDNSSEANDSSSVGEASDTPADSRVSFLACPDNIMHKSLLYDAAELEAKNNGTTVNKSDLHNAKYDFSRMYGHVASAIKNADISYLNQETLINGTGSPVSGYPRFNTPLAVAEEDIALGFDVINVAHNHMLDSGSSKGLANCASVFEESGLTVIGYYPDSESVSVIPVIEKNGIRIAFLAYTYGTNGISLRDGSGTVIPYFDRELIEKQVFIAKQVSDFLIVSCHWGYENNYKQNSEQSEYAALMCELGVDVVLGMHPHVIQPAEWMENSEGHRTLVVYSLGNFVSGMVSGRNMLGLMLSLDIVKDGTTGEIRMENVVLIPTVTHRDSSYRNFEIYYLSEYTEELAAKHGVVRYERSNGTTLIGGAYSRANLVKTLQSVIPSEFLPEEFKKSNDA